MINLKYEVIMKNLHYYFMLSMMLLFSCQQEEIIYSCDPEMDDYIKSNISEIQTMSTAEFLKIEKELQPSIFNVLKVKQKQQIWLDKYEDALKLNWTDEEREHIMLLIRYIQDNKTFFEDPKKYEDEISIFAYKWRRYAENVLMWDNNMIYSMVYDPGYLIKDSQNKLIIIENNDFSEKTNIPILTKKFKKREENNPPPTVKCSCNEAVNDCGTTGLMTCRKWNCIAIYGCGFLFQAVCDGGCYRNDL